MILPALSRRQFMLISLQLLAASQLPACRSQSPVLGRDSLKPLMVEDHHMALAHWAEKGIRDAVLINFDTHDDMRWIPEEKIGTLQNIYRQKDWQKFRRAGGLADNTPYHIGNWIYAGGRLGIFREVYWVIPFNVLSMNDPDYHMRRFLKEYEFNDQEIGTFTLQGGQFRGSFHGVPLTICDLHSLPDISSPLLLSVDTDFFPPYSTSQEKNYLPALHGVFQALHAKNYKILDTVVSYSVNGDFLPPYLRWVGDTLGMLLEKPNQLQTEPTELLLLLQQLESDYRSTDTAQMLDFIERSSPRYSTASLQAYAALAHLLRDDHEQAFEAARSSCAMDHNYCTLLPYLGIYYYNGGNLAMAEKFFLAGFAANPEMANGLFHYGHCLRKTGRLKEALKTYEKDEAVNGTFPTRFLIAETQFLLNDGKAATASITKAVQHLSGHRYASVVNRETARAIYTALDLCKREGNASLYRTLSTNPAVVSMFAKYPRQTLH